MKKSVCVVLASAIVMAAATSGCQSSKPAVSDSASGVTQRTYSLYTLGSTTPLDLSSTVVGKEVTKLTGVAVKCDYQVGDDENTISATQTASGTYDDMINCHNEFEVYRAAGALVPLDDYIEKSGTNIKKWYSDDLKKLKDATDGHIYSLSPARKSTTPLYSTSGFYVQKRILEANNWPNHMSLDDFFTMIEKYAEENPTFQGKSVIPFAGRGDNDGSYLISNVPDYLAGNPNTGAQYFDEDGTAHNFALSDWSHDYFKKLNDESFKGIIDTNMFAQTADQYHANIASGRVLAFYDEHWSLTDQISSLEDQKLYDEVPVAISVTFDGGTNESYNGITSISAAQGICISTSCKDPEGAFKFLDQMCSEELLKLTEWGIAGTDYTLGSDGKMSLSSEQLAKSSDVDLAKSRGVGYWWSFPHPNLDSETLYSDGNFISPQDTTEYISAHYKDYEKEILKAYKVDSFYEMMNPSKESKFGYGWDINVPDSMTTELTAQQKATEVTQKYMPKLIFAGSGKFESVWDSYKKEMVANNYNVTDAYFTQQAQKRIKDWN